MPKLPVVTPQKLIKALENIGFVRTGGSGSHKVMKHQNGKRTTIPIHGKDIPKGTLLAILRDIEISKDELIMLLKK
jgi:predicted RNA binding protein YcfA (HicA-like mRNA interferase family)